MDDVWKYVVGAAAGAAAVGASLQLYNMIEARQLLESAAQTKAPRQEQLVMRPEKQIQDFHDRIQAQKKAAERDEEKQSQPAATTLGDPDLTTKEAAAALRKLQEPLKRLSSRTRAGSLG